MLWSEPGSFKQTHSLGVRSEFCVAIGLPLYYNSSDLAVLSIAVTNQPCSFSYFMHSSHQQMVPDCAHRILESVTHCMKFSLRLCRKLVYDWLGQAHCSLTRLVPACCGARLIVGLPLSPPAPTSCSPKRRSPPAATVRLCLCLCLKSVRKLFMQCLK